MNQAEIKSRINHGIKVVTGKSIEDFDSNQSLFELLKIESIDFVDLIFEIEKSLECEIDISELVQGSFDVNLGRFGMITPKSFYGYISNVLKKSGRLD